MANDIFWKSVSATAMTAAVCSGLDSCDECGLVNKEEYLAGAWWLIFHCDQHEADRLIISNSDTQPDNNDVVACEVKVLGKLLASE